MGVLLEINEVYKDIGSASKIFSELIDNKIYEYQIYIDHFDGIHIGLDPVKLLDREDLSFLDTEVLYKNDFILRMEEKYSLPLDNFDIYFKIKGIRRYFTINRIKGLLFFPFGRKYSNIVQNTFVFKDGYFVNGDTSLINLMYRLKTIGFQDEFINNLKPYEL